MNNAIRNVSSQDILQGMKTTDSGSAMLKATNIRKIYYQGKTELSVLKGINLTIEAGDVVSIVGPSGAGKSTLLHILGALDKPNEGNVILGGQDIYALNDVQRARVRNQKIGFIFQFYHLLPEFSALENVILPALIQKDMSKTSELEARGKEILNQVGLSQRVSHKPHELSGGEQQRVAIARALMNNPSILFCDEPTGNLDSESGRSIIEILMGLNQKIKQTCVIVTHDEQIAKLSHKIVHMRDGQIV